MGKLKSQSKVQERDKRRARASTDELEKNNPPNSNKGEKTKQGNIKKTQKPTTKISAKTVREFIMHTPEQRFE